jgi:hypothetical protein
LILGRGKIHKFELKKVYKLKLSLCLINETLCHEDAWKSGGIVPPVLTSAVEGVELSALRPCRFVTEKTNRGTYWREGWVGTRAGMESAEKIQTLPHRESKTHLRARSLSLYRLSYHERMTYKMGIIFNFVITSCTYIILDQIVTVFLLLQWMCISVSSSGHDMLVRLVKGMQIQQN